MKKAILFAALIVASAMNNVFGQCAMCRTTLENNYSNGDPGIAAGLNTGILYLLAMPYLAVIVIGYFWYKSSRNAQKELHSSTAAR